jgi:anti-anti-sigma factor
MFVSQSQTQSMPLQHTRTFPAQYDHIRDLCQFVLQGAATGGFEEAAYFQIELACDEASTNIIEHAYEGRDDGEIRVGWQLSAGSLIITLHDNGEPFDPTDVVAPPIVTQDADLEDIRIGGLGMHFMRTVMDDVAYEFDPVTGNTLTMRLQLPNGKRPPIWQYALDGVQVVGVTGRLDHNTVPTLERTLLDVIAADHAWIIADLTEVTYINSGGLRALVTAWRQARHRQGDLVIAGMSERVASVFNMIGFDKVFQTFATVNSAQQRLLQAQSGN